MANIKSAEKRNRQSAKARERNRRDRTRMRSAIRRLRQTAEAGDAAAARAALPGTLSVIDSSATKGIIHRNTASRYKSRLTKLVAGLEAAAE